MYENKVTIVIKQMGYIRHNQQLSKVDVQILREEGLTYKLRK